MVAMCLPAVSTTSKVKISEYLPIIYTPNQHPNAVWTCTCHSPTVVMAGVQYGERFIDYRWFNAVAIRAVFKTRTD